MDTLLLLLFVKPSSGRSDDANRACASTYLAAATFIHAPRRNCTPYMELLKDRAHSPFTIDPTIRDYDCVHNGNASV